MAEALRSDRSGKLPEDVKPRVEDFQLPELREPEEAILDGEIIDGEYTKQSSQPDDPQGDIIDAEIVPPEALPSVKKRPAIAAPPKPTTDHTKVREAYGENAIEPGGQVNFHI